METRDRLIELIKIAKKNTKGASCDLERNMLLAESLLANGVIVPPCKVGDTVYCLETIGNKINDYVVQNVGITATQGGWGIERGFDAFGKTVFLTKEEAEANLKEMKGNG